MRKDYAKTTLAAVRRLEGLTAKLKTMVEEGAYCSDILQLLLSMQGHLKHIQGHVLESHLHTCATKRLASNKEKDAFISDLVKVIGLSSR
jgi:CsoR family transcriptional regulator, copper-sensing transcriptional repressor